MIRAPMEALMRALMKVPTTAQMKDLIKACRVNADEELAQR